MNKYGIENFYVTTIAETCADSKMNLRSNLNELEQKYIDEFGSASPNGYNMTTGGQSFAINSSRKVCMAIDSGDIVMKFDSIRNAGEMTGIDEKTINHACNSKSHYGGGVFWYYYDPSQNIDVGNNIGTQSKGKRNWIGKPSNQTSWKHLDNRKCIAQYSKDGDFIQEFRSLKEASESLNICYSTISSCAHGKKKSAGGYIWKLCK